MVTQVIFLLTQSFNFNRPDVIYDIPKMLLSSYGPLALKWNYIPKMIPWILKYLKSSTKKINDAHNKIYASNFRFIS